MRIVQFEIGGATHCGVELDTCARPPVRPNKRLSAPHCKDRRCSEVVDLTAANVAADTLALAKMGDIGLGAAAAVRSPPPLPPPAATASGRCDFLRAVQVVKSGKYRVSKPVKLLAPINGVRASPNLSRLRPGPGPGPGGSRSCARLR